MLFSVIIPTYNYAHCIARTVESVLRQQGTDYELIVIDDGSTDNTADVIRALQSKYPSQIAYYRQNNSGPAAARNHGIDVSIGQYLLFLDADDALTESALPTIRRSIDIQPEVRMIIGGHIAVSTPDATEQERYHPPGSLPDGALSRVTAYLLEKKLSISHGACVMHRDVFANYRYPEHFRNSEDIPVFSYALANFATITVDHPIARIYKHPDSLRHNTSYAIGIGSTIVDEIFEPKRMPGRLQKIKDKYNIQRNLSLSRTFFIAGDYTSCCHFFGVALRSNWTVLSKWSYTGKAIRAFLKTKISNIRNKKMI